MHYFKQAKRYTLIVSLCFIATTGYVVEGAAGEVENPPSLTHQIIGRHVSGTYGEGAAEIVQYHKKSQRIFVLNGAANAVDILAVSDLESVAVADPISANNLAATSLRLPEAVDISETSHTLGGATSIAISGDLLAVAISNENKQAEGVVVFYDLSEEAPSPIKAVLAGALPDMVTFTPDGTKALVANEGEPGDVDPEGSVAVIEIVDGVPADTATILDFTAFNTNIDPLVKIDPAAPSVAADLEPEYIAVSADSKMAYATLQENNAIAFIDLEAKAIAKIVPLGFKDYGKAGNEIDASDKDDAINIAAYQKVFGMYQPDTIATYTWDGQTFLVTSNEGDARDATEARVKDLTLDPAHPHAEDAQDKKVLGRLKVTTVLGDTDNDGDYDELYSYGSRSFSIWNADGELVFDSGSDIERITAERFGEHFNNNENENKGDSRSDDKGPEPEALAVGQIGGRAYAFVGLERMGGFMIYDVTNPSEVTFIDYVNNRDLTVEFEIDDEQDPLLLEGEYAKAGDLAPEGMKFLSAEESPTGKALLIVGNEVSGTTTVYEFEIQ